MSRPAVRHFHLVTQLQTEIGCYADVDASRFILDGKTLVERTSANPAGRKRDCAFDGNGCAQRQRAGITYFDDAGRQTASRRSDYREASSQH